MSLAPDSQLIGLVDINRLLSDAHDLSVAVPKAWSTEPVQKQLEARVAAMLDAFATGLYQIDIQAITDDRYSELEGWTRVVADLVQSYMFIRYRDSDCQPFASLLKRLRSALDGFELGVALDPTKRQTVDEIFAQHDAAFAALKIF